MKRDGFTIVELIVVIAIMGILLTMGSLYYNKMNRKSGIESQVKQMYADLADARSQALYRKTCRYVTVTGTQFSVYTSSVCGDTAPTSGAIVNKTLKYPIAATPADSLCFDQRGVANLTSTDITATYKAICVQPNDPDMLTSIVVSATEIKMGKLKAGSTCSDAPTNNPPNIAPQ